MNNIAGNLAILDRLTAVNLNVVIWTARKKLTVSDFGSIELPPEELASLGNKKICDPESLKVFSTLKARAVGCLDKVGVKFLGGWAIPEEESDSVHEHLLEIKQEFLTAKDTFLNNYDMEVKSWVDKHPGWKQLIATSTVSSDYVKTRLNFNWQFYKVACPTGSDTTAESLTNEVNSLGQTLFGEISKEAQCIWNKVYAGKTEVSHKALSPLKAMKHKLTGLSFVEPRVAPVADLIETAILNVPKRGFISGLPLVTLQGLVAMLRDPELLIEHGQKVIDGLNPKDILSSLSPCSDDRNEPNFDDFNELEELEDLEPETGPQDDQPSNLNNQPARPYVDSLGLW